jgi:hypothetical protein
MLIVKASADSEAGKMPPAELIEQMGRFNEEMAKAGVLVYAEGLKPTSQGARVHFKPGAKPTVMDGPFAETKELMAGFWIIQAKSKEEAIQWAMRSPSPHPGQECDIEVRPFFETDDFPSEVMSDEEKAKEHALREELERKAR